MSKGAPKGSTRWWMVDEHGTIKRIRCDAGETMPPPWRRGHPQQKSQTTIDRIAEIGRQPKSQQQRDKMREAKLGIPKSANHRAQMSIAHIERAERVRQLREQQPHLSYRAAVSLEASIRKNK